MRKLSEKLSQSCGGFRKLGCRTIHVGFPDALRFAFATHCHDFTREFVLIEGNSDRAPILWTKHARIPRLDRIAELAGIREAARCPPSLTD
jgi:hypothetical protein